MRTTSAGLELESDIEDFVDWDRNWLVDSGAKKTRLVSSDYLFFSDKNLM